MIYRLILVLLLPILILIPACSTSQETTKEEKKEETKEADVYVFDKAPENENQTPAVTETPAPPYYIVQIGAFTTKEKADAFALESKSRIENQIEVRFSNSVNLYVVQVVPFLKTRAEAEGVRNKLWRTDGYQDAWIITVK